MAERALTKPEIASQKRVLKLPPAIGDWTTYRPPKILVKKVKSGLYGFDRLSKEETNQALLIHYRFIQALLQRLRVDLSMAIEFLSCQVEQTTYLNFLRTLNASFAQGKLSLANMHENIQLLTDINLANSVINHALGSHDLEPLNRGLTEAERTVLTTALEAYLPHYAAAFNNIFPVPQYTFVGSPDVALDPAINPSSTFIAFSAEIAVNEMSQGKIIFGYPGNSLKSLLKSFAGKEEHRPLNFNRLPSSALAGIVAHLSATLGKTRLSTSEINSLEVGDVVSLDTMTNSPVVLSVGNLIKILAQPGLLGKKKAVRIAGFRENDKIEVASPVIETKAEALSEVVAPAVEEKILPEAELPVEEEELFDEELADEEFAEEEEFPEEEFTEEEEFEEENKGV